MSSLHQTPRVTEKPLTREEMARKVAQDIPSGAFVNLGIGQPTKVADYLDPENGVTLHTENGMLGMGPEAHGEEIDPDLINAGKIPVKETPGTSYFHHADSFAMMRGGHLDICVLGAFQVAENGDLANWSTGAPGSIPAVGGAMDLAIGAKQTFVMMNLLSKDGSAKLVRECTFPLTGVGCVSRAYTDLAIFELDGGRVHVRETFGIDAAQLAEELDVELHGPLTGREEKPGASESTGWARP
ncbi:3-oxoacid CoA-transferase subunit B [Rothia uropygialis]|uniref:3-oxoacid CoA-transferase subunit B n=1 Tax=Kocuria sp. 36 TaxID=1415402 RepID=UPI00101E0135|nr:3-oxoacid CoA-transferase subunit B [Kocuria sp. 36]